MCTCIMYKISFFNGKITSSQIIYTVGLWPRVIIMSLAFDLPQHAVKVCKICSTCSHNVPDLALTEVMVTKALWSWGHSLHVLAPTGGHSLHDLTQYEVTGISWPRSTVNEPSATVNAARISAPSEVIKILASVWPKVNRRMTLLHLSPSPSSVAVHSW